MADQPRGERGVGIGEHNGGEDQIDSSASEVIPGNDDETDRRPALAARLGIGLHLLVSALLIDLNGRGN